MSRVVIPLSVILVAIWLVLRALLPAPWDHVPWILLIGLVAFLRFHTSLGFSYVLLEGIASTLWGTETWMIVPFAAIVALCVEWILRHYITHMSLYTMFAIIFLCTFVWVVVVVAIDLSVAMPLLITEAVWIAGASAVVVTAAAMLFSPSSPRV